MSSQFGRPRSAHFVWNTSRYVPRLSLVLVLALIATLVAFPIQAVQAATITVTTTVDELNADGDCSLREAIRAANLNTAVDACAAGSGADTINVPAGTFTLTREGADDTASGGDLDLTGTLTLIGADAVSSIIDGNQIDRIFDVQPGATVTIRDMTIRNGLLVTAPVVGGGVHNRGTLNLIDTIVRDNLVNGYVAGDDNGGLDGTGGGIANDGTLSVVRGYIQGNRAQGSPLGSGGTGGGLVNISGTATLTNVLIAENDAWPGRNGTGRGGGIANLGGNVVATKTMVTNNGAHGSVEAEGFGGGIFNSATMTLTQTTVNDNSVDGGVFGTGKAGGIYNAGTLTANNSTISGNSAFGYSSGGVGGVDNAGGDLMLNNVTLSNNHVASDADGSVVGGLVNGTSREDSSMGVVRLSNTILANNTIGAEQPSDCKGSIQSRGYNLIEQFADCTITDTTSGNLLGVDPRLDALQDNGGSTATQALQPGSPAIDAGNPAEPGSGSTACATTDQRGVLRPQDGNADGTARCDIGAYERPAGAVYVVIDVAASCTYDEYADGDTIVAHITFVVAGGSATLDQLTATLVGATGGNVTYVPSLVGGTLQPGSTRMTATFRDYTIPTTSEIRVTVDAKIGGSLQSVTSEPALNCETQIPPSPSPSPSPKPMLRHVFLPMVQREHDR